LPSCLYEMGTQGQLLIIEGIINLENKMGTTHSM
jgi:hypothetical protein